MKKEKGIMYKSDIKKAYDTINWSFLLTSLQNMGFGGRWIISIESFSVIINSSPIDFFKSSRGLKQGDSLSPYLFVLGIEVFLILINKAAGGGFLSGFSLRERTGEVQVTHLLFEDDTLAFCKDLREELVHLNWILLWFEALSGMKINLSKIVILPVGSVENLECLAIELCWVCTLSITMSHID